MSSILSLIWSRRALCRSTNRRNNWVPAAPIISSMYYTAHSTLRSTKQYTPQYCTAQSYSTSLRCTVLRLYSTVQHSTALYLHCVSKQNISDIFDCNFKTNCQILIIFVMNIPDTSCHQMTVQFSTSPNVMLLHYLGKSDQAKYVLK